MGLREYLFGKSSEDRACDFLKNREFVIKERNFHSKFGEIDIIATDGNGILCFIEVKASEGNYDATFRLTKQKYEKILKTINFYFMKNEIDSNFEIDFLVINKNDIKLIRNISL